MKKIKVDSIILTYIISALVMTTILLAITIIFDDVIISYTIPSMVVNLIYWALLIVIRLLIISTKGRKK